MKNQNIGNFDEFKIELKIKQLGEQKDGRSRGKGQYEFRCRFLVLLLRNINGNIETVSEKERKLIRCFLLKISDSDRNRLA